MRSSTRVLTRKASTYFLVTPLGTQEQSTSVPMAGEKGDASKVDPVNTININYEDLPEDQRLKFEADLKRQNEEIKARMLAFYGKTRHGVIEKEKFVMPSISSATPPPPVPPVVNVSSSPQDLYNMLLSDLGKNINDAHRFVLVATDYFTKWTETVPLKNMTHREVIEFMGGHSDNPKISGRVFRIFKTSGF